MNIPYFAFYPADWISDPKLISLTHEEKGILIDLFCHMWNHKKGDCFLPDRDSFISRLLHIHHHKWKKIKELLVEELQILHIDDGKILSKRLSIEYTKSCVKSSLQKSNAISRWGVDRNKSLNNKDRIDAMALPSQCHKDKDKDKDINIIKKEIKKEKKVQSYFEVFWKKYPIKKSKDQARKAFEKLKCSEEFSDKLILALDGQIEERQLKKLLNLFVPEWKYAATWLNNHCWEDEVCVDKEKLNAEKCSKLGEDHPLWGHNS